MQNHTNQDVLRFHIAVDDLVVVEVVQRSNQLLSDVLNNALWKGFIVFKNLKKLPCMSRELFRLNLSNIRLM